MIGIARQRESSGASKGVAYEISQRLSTHMRLGVAPQQEQRRLSVCGQCDGVLLVGQLQSVKQCCILTADQTRHQQAKLYWR